MTHFASPYQLNPFNFNSFRDMLAEAIDFDRVRRQTALKLFICATDVQTAKVKIFAGKGLRVDHVLASTCLPLLMQAVEIDGDDHWDGISAIRQSIRWSTNASHATFCWSTSPPPSAHSLKQRLARWLLMMRDRNDGDVLPTAPEPARRNAGCPKANHHECCPRV